MCPVGRGCCLENSLDVKVSWVQIPNMACLLKDATSSHYREAKILESSFVEIVANPLVLESNEKV